jgi:hypothetical protein
MQVIGLCVTMAKRDFDAARSDMAAARAAYETSRAETERAYKRLRLAIDATRAAAADAINATLGDALAAQLQAPVPVPAPTTAPANASAADDISQDSADEASVSQSPRQCQWYKTDTRTGPRDRCERTAVHVTAHSAFCNVHTCTICRERKAVNARIVCSRCIRERIADERARTGAVHE